MARIMKDSGIEWAGLIPDSWDSMSFWQAIERMGTGLNPRDNFELTKDDSCYYVTIRNFKDGVLYLDDNCDRISEKAWAIIQERSDLHSGDILFASISKDGQAYILKTEAKNWNINESVFCIRINKNLYQNRFFYYHLINVAYYDDLRRDATGSTFQSIKQNKLRKSRLLHPSLPEQVSIATYLDTECSRIDSVIEQTRASIEEYKKLKQAVITQAVTKGIRPNREMKDSGIEWIGDIPNEWDLSRVGLHFIIILGKMLCSNPLSDMYSLEPYYCAANVHFDGVSNNDLKEMWFSPVEKDLYLVKQGDLLVVEGGAGAGGCAIVKSLQQDVYIQNSVMIVRPKVKASNKYLRYLLECLVKSGYIDVACNKATIPHFTKEKLANVPFLVSNEQQEIVDYLDKKIAEIDSLIIKKQTLLTELESYKKSLIFEYVTGKREVPA